MVGIMVGGAVVQPLRDQMCNYLLRNCRTPLTIDVVERTNCVVQLSVFFGSTSTTVAAQVDEIEAREVGTRARTPIAAPSFDVRQGAPLSDTFDDLCQATALAIDAHYRDPDLIIIEDLERDAAAAHQIIDLQTPDGPPMTFDQRALRDD